MARPIPTQNFPWLFPSKRRLPTTPRGDIIPGTYRERYLRKASYVPFPIPPEVSSPVPAISPVTTPTPATRGTGQSYYLPSLISRAESTRAAGTQQSPNAAPSTTIPFYQWYLNQIEQLGFRPPDFNLPETPDVPPAPAGGGTSGGGGTRYTPAPAGVDPTWYRQFQQEHGGLTPEEFYAQTGEDIGHALADDEWGQEFYRANGRPPNDYEWRWHWFMTRTGHPPPEGMEQWMREQRGAEEEKEKEQRPPIYQPPMIIWR